MKEEQTKNKKGINMEKIYSLLSVCPYRLRVRGEMDRIATKVLSIFKPPEERSDGEECKDGGRKKRRDEERLFRQMESDGQCQSQRERDMRRMRFVAEELSLLLGDHRSGGAAITGASWWWRRLNAEDAGCMLIKQNTN